jgi:LCP family protein required for cell wall assembly
MANNQSELDAMPSVAPTDPGDYKPRKSVRKKRNTKRTWLIVIGSIIALIGIAIGVTYALISSSYNEIERVEIIDPGLSRPEAVEVAKDEKAPINILLLGSDSRETTSADATVDDISGFRTDAILVAQVSADRQDITIMSIMRDNWVPIQGHGEAKINAAAAFGGIPLAVNTVETFIDSRIDHVAIVDFESFQGLTDAVGGVAINNPIAFTNQNGGNSTFAAGEITLNGTQALHFVRERYAFSDGDYQRARNQQIYLKGLMSQILSKDTLTNPTKITSTFNALTPYLIVDQGLNLNNAIGLGLELKDVRSDDITFFTSPTLGTGTSGDGQSIVLPDWAEIENLRAAVREGTLNDFATAQQAKE